METGVTLPRQRLIYRGRVLKNDQMLASYALEDGHVLHLVVRALPPPSSTDVVSTDNQQQDTAAATSAAPDRPAAGRAATAAAPNSQFPPSATYLATLDEMDAMNARLDEFDRSALRTRSRSRLRQRRARSPPAPPRDNDEPDPTMGRSSMGAQPGRVLMGATITVPEGTNVTMPFLSSMIADLATQVSENTAVEGKQEARHWECYPKDNDMWHFRVTFWAALLLLRWTQLLHARFVITTGTVIPWETNALLAVLFLVQIAKLLCALALDFDSSQCVQRWMTRRLIFPRS